MLNLIEVYIYNIGILWIEIEIWSRKKKRIILFNEKFFLNKFFFCSNIGVFIRFWRFFGIWLSRESIRNKNFRLELIIFWIRMRDFWVFRLILVGLIFSRILLFFINV
jgi:hypothetical protein